MCRVLSYLGEPLLLEDLLYKPDVSFVNQTHQAALLHRLNLAGSGLLAWDARSARPSLPYSHHTTQLAIYDRNLRAMASKIEATCVLAHLRGVVYDHRANLSEQNLHPFQFEGTRLTLAHNGQLARFDEMKIGLLPHIRPDLYRQIRGNTDSEWTYALVLSQLDDHRADFQATEILDATRSALRVIGDVRKDLGIRTFSPMNLFLSDGNDIIATCYTYDIDCYEGLGDSFHPYDEDVLRIWYTSGRSFGCHDGEWKMLGERHEAQSCIIASEPLTRDRTGWTMVPMQHSIFVSHQGNSARVEIAPLD